MPNIYLIKYDDDPFDDSEKNKQLVRRLNYLAVNRLDIAYVVNVVNQFMSTPTVKHWEALEYIFCYLKGASGLSILFSNHSHTYIEHFANVDWVESKIDRRSTMVY